MKLLEIVSAVKAAQPKLFTKISDAEAHKFALGLLAEIGRLVDNTQEGAAVIPKFGHFKIKHVPSKDDPQAKIRRIAFVRAAPVEKGGKKKVG